MKINEIYSEKLSKNSEIDKKQGLSAINNKTLNKITMQKRGLCTIDGEDHEFMQVTVYFKKT